MNQCDHNSFESEVLNSNIPVLVIFTTTWFFGCKKQISVIEDLIDQYKNKIKFIEMNIDDLISSPSIITSYKIRSTPTLLFIRNSKVVKTHCGFLTKEDIIDFLDKIHLLAFL